MEQIDKTVAMAQAVANATAHAADFGTRLGDSFAFSPKEAAVREASFFSFLLMAFAVTGSVVLIASRTLGLLVFKEYKPAGSEDNAEGGGCTGPSRSTTCELVFETAMSVIWPSLLEEFVYCAVLFNALCVWGGTPWAGQAAYPVTSPWNAQTGFLLAWLVTLATSSAVQAVFVLQARQQCFTAFADCLGCVERVACCCCCCAPKVSSLRHAGCLFWRADFDKIRSSRCVAFMFVLGGAATRWLCTFVYYYAGCILWPGVGLRFLCVVLFRVGYGRYERDDATEDAPPNKITELAAHALNSMPPMSAASPPRLDVRSVDLEGERSLL